MTTVRLYRHRDEQQLRDIAVLSYTDQSSAAGSIDLDDPGLQAYLAHIIQMSSSNKGAILVAEQDNRLIGFVCLLKPDIAVPANEGEGVYAFMSDLFVIPECRNQGVGTLLTRKLEEQARVMGAASVAMRVAAENQGARQFYVNKRYQEKFVVMSKELSD